MLRTVKRIVKRELREAIKQGTRAHGDTFDVEYHRGYYADIPMDKLEDAIASNKKLGDAAFTRGSVVGGYA